MAKLEVVVGGLKIVLVGSALSLGQTKTAGRTVRAVMIAGVVQALAMPG